MALRVTARVRLNQLTRHIHTFFVRITTTLATTATLHIRIDNRMHPIHIHPQYTRHTYMFLSIMMTTVMTMTRLIRMMMMMTTMAIIAMMMMVVTMTMNQT